jgi:hypothetical protein
MRMKFLFDLTLAYSHQSRLINLMFNPENEVKTNHRHTAVNYPHKHIERIQGGLP